MTVLITGATSGIGRDMARSFAERNMDLILVGRDETRLREITRELSGTVKVEGILCDLTNAQACRALYQRVRERPVDILVNNAGFGDCGDFAETDLNKDLRMIQTNITALHILTKLFLRDFVQRDRGCILNVASSAAFLAGPEMATYYATKNYVYRLSQAIWEELRQNGSHVQISVLCPGPVDTGFNAVANVKFALPGMDSPTVAEYAVTQLMKGRFCIIPGLTMKLARIAVKLAPESVVLGFAYRAQRSKLGKV